MNSEALADFNHENPFLTAISVLEVTSNPEIAPKYKVKLTTGKWPENVSFSDFFKCWDNLQLDRVRFIGMEFVPWMCAQERIMMRSSSDRTIVVGIRGPKIVVVAHAVHDAPLWAIPHRFSQLIGDFERGTGDMTRKRVLAVAVKRHGESVKDPGSMEGIPFTARLMAHYRAVESKKENPLVVDPLAERLTGDLSEYLISRPKYSMIDYPLVRDHYINEKILKKWCSSDRESQITFLGAGLDTRAYNYPLLDMTRHKLFEIDFPDLITYKERILEGEAPLCQLFRIGTDLSTPEWFEKLIAAGYDPNLPTLWIMEGLLYYIPKDEAKALLTKCGQSCANGSAIFVDLLVHSQWISQEESSKNIGSGPFLGYMKWGIDIIETKDFFDELGWEVEPCDAVDHDMGRDVPPKAMLFVEGSLKTN